jgi:hypothetical protein
MAFLFGPNGWKSNEAKSRLYGRWASTAQPGLGVAFLVRSLVKIRFTCPCFKYLVACCNLFHSAFFFLYGIHNKTFVYKQSGFLSPVATIITLDDLNFSLRADYRHQRIPLLDATYLPFTRLKCFRFCCPL